MPMQSKKLIGYLKDMLINSLQAIKDEEYQRRVWFHQDGPEVDSYIDSTSYFLESCEFIFKLPDVIENLGGQNYQLLKQLYDLVSVHVDRIEQKRDPYQLEEEELLNDPKWQDIQSIAEKVYNALEDFIGKNKE